MMMQEIVGAERVGRNWGVEGPTQGGRGQGGDDYYDEDDVGDRVEEVADDSDDSDDDAMINQLSRKRSL